MLVLIVLCGIVLLFLLNDFMKLVGLNCCFAMIWLWFVGFWLWVLWLALLVCCWSGRLALLYVCLMFNSVGVALFDSRCGVCSVSYSLLYCLFVFWFAWFVLLNRLSCFRVLLWVMVLWFGVYFLLVWFCGFGVV